jgi:hypothetical protein
MMIFTASSESPNSVAKAERIALTTDGSLANAVASLTYSSRTPVTLVTPWRIIERLVLRDVVLVLVLDGTPAVAVNEELDDKDDNVVDTVLDVNTFRKVVVVVVVTLVAVTVNDVDCTFANVVEDEVVSNSVEVLESILVVMLDVGNVVEKVVVVVIMLVVDVVELSSLSSTEVAKMGDNAMAITKRRGIVNYGKK